MRGKIIKGIAGFYYVSTEDAGVLECKAKGIFRNHGRKPLVGDNVCVDGVDAVAQTATVTEILPRKNELLRPAVANVDQVMLLFAVTDPEPNFNLLNRFLVRMARQGLPVLLCFNKSDLAAIGIQEEIQKIYRGAGCELCFLSAKKQEGTEELKSLLFGKTTVLSGPSGVGKSTLVNVLQPDICMETGSISEKIRRGRHTTRHSEFIRMDAQTYLMDTPGFSSLTLEDMEAEELKGCFPEFLPYEGSCRFRGCMHENEPDCAVKRAVEDGGISRKRYGDYVSFYRELKQRKKYK